MHTLTLLSLTAMMAISNLLHAQDTSKDPSAQEVATHIQQLIKDHRNQDSINQALELAKLHPNAEGAPHAALLAATRSQKSEIRKSAKTLLMTTFIHHDTLANYCRHLARGHGQEQVNELQTILLRSNNANVRRAATYHMASLLIRLKDMRADYSAERKHVINEQALTLLKALKNDPELSKPESASLLAAVEQKIFIAEHLSIGKTAPEIEGTDHAGQSFKLSDYRGKVTLVDFWGFW